MTKEELKKIAVDMVEKNGLINLSRKSLCEAAGIPDGSFYSVAGKTFNDLLSELIEDGVQSAICTSSKSRASKAVRKEHLLTVAVQIAKDIGYNHVSRSEVAKRSGVSESLIGHYFGTMAQLKRDIIRFAIRKEIVEIIAQGIANQDPHAKKAPQELKQRAVDQFLANI